MILQADKPDDFVLATGETRSVREMVELAFAQVGRRIAWRGAGVDETGIDAKSGKTVVKIDPAYFRPTEVDLLVGDASKAREVLGWKPKRNFAGLVAEMMARAIWRKQNGTPPVANAPFELNGKSVYVAGHRGMVGGALVRRLAREDVKLVTVDRREVDLCNQAAVFDWFAKTRPQVVFLAAAKVGGIVANNTLRAEFIYDNIAIAANVIHAAHPYGAEKLLFLGSSASIRGSPRSPCVKTPYRPARWSRPTSPMRSPKSPASRWRRPIAANTAATSSA
jgi:nucleoside-diphosphate-sugar epimerase